MGGSTGAPEPTLSFSLASRPEEIERVCDGIDQLAERAGLATSVVFAVKLALEEAVLNVINYAHKANGGHQIEILLYLTDAALTLEIVDDGEEFDPLTEAPEPDIDAPIDERKVGGLGIHLIREMMDEVGYRRADDRNRLTMVKRREG